MSAIGRLTCARSGALGAAFGTRKVRGRKVRQHGQVQPSSFPVRFLLATLLTCGVAAAQPYTISTVVGGSAPPSSVPAVSTPIDDLRGVTSDSNGSVYFVSSHCVYKMDATGVLTRVAGNGRPGYSGDGGYAASAQLNQPSGIALDGSGNLYIADWYNSRVRKVSPGGIITTFAGNGSWGSDGDGGPATQAELSYPYGVAVDASGNVYISDYPANRIRKVSTGGTITTFAGKGGGGYSGDGGQATDALLSAPEELAIDSAGNLYVADFGNNRVRKISAGGIISTVAGTGTGGFSGDEGLATTANLDHPTSVVVDGTGALYIADRNNNRIRKVSSNGIIRTFAGGVISASLGDGGPATGATLSWPCGLALDGSGNLYIADSVHLRLRKVSADGVITTVAGNGSYDSSGDGGPASSAKLSFPAAVVFDGSGNLYISDAYNHKVRKVSSAGIITTVAGSGAFQCSGDGGQATSAGFGRPRQLAFDGSGNLYIVDHLCHQVRKVAPSGIITTVAGTGSQGFSGDGGLATAAKLSYPLGTAVDAAGNLYIADFGNQRVRKVTTTGVISTVAGTGVIGFSGDGGPAVNAQLNSPESIAFDSAGSLYIADSYNRRVRKISADGVITTVAGNGSNGQGGDGVPALSTAVNPNGVATDGAGNLYIADAVNQIRKVSRDGTISTIAGTGWPGYSGDGGPATSAQLDYPVGLVVDGSGNVYFADSFSNAVRVLRPAGSATVLAIGTTSPLADGIVGAAYFQLLSATGGVSPYAWTVTAGALPAGLTLGAGGAVAGTPSSPGVYTFTVQVKDSLAATAIQDFQLTIFDAADVPPTVYAGGIVNAASNAPGQAIAPGEAVSIYGSNLATSTAYASSIPLPTSLDNVSVTFNGVLAPLFFVSPGQINAQVPWDVLSGQAQTGNAEVTVTRAGVRSPAATVAVAPFAPGIFTVNSGTGTAIAINPDGTLATPDHPAKAGDPNGLVILATGLGALDSPLASGANSLDKLRKVVTPPQVTVGGVPATVTFAGASPQFVAINQVNVLLPEATPAGNAVDLKFQIGQTSTAGGVTIAVKSCCGSTTLTPSDSLAVSGTSGKLNLSSYTKTYTLTNPHSTAISYSVAASTGWVSIANSSGTVAAGSSQAITISLNSQANTLAAGTYAATVTFTDNTFGTSLTRMVTLTLSAGECVNIAGQWVASETGKLTCTVTVGGESDTETDPISGGDLITMSQQGCKVSYTSPSMMAEFGAGSSVRQGEVKGSTVTFTGIMGQLGAGFTYDKNVMQATGSVGDGVINLTGSGTLNGSGTWMGMATTFSCTASTTATLTKFQ
jgi:trimeric autotransporter adhesin